MEEVIFNEGCGAECFICGVDLEGKGYMVNIDGECEFYCEDCGE